MHNTVGDVALTNISRETKNFQDFVEYDTSTGQNKSSSPFLSLGYVLRMFLNFGHFSASRSYKNGSYEEKSVHNMQLLSL